ncbi:MAG: aldo/keto reductase, partial [Chloroflexi bacterium]|nr:aldo/keto reductase [Chloroflexota bacterium]
TAQAVFLIKGVFPVRYHPLGKTGSQVSLIGLGCARFGGIFAPKSKTEYVQLIHQAIAEGITLFDTADMYAQGESEQILGDALHGHRQSVLISTKVGYCLPAQRYVASALKPLLRPVLQALHLRRTSLPTALRGLPTQNFSPTYIITAAEQCLRRLQTDYIDLLLLHSPPAAVLASGEFLEPLETLRAQGKVRYLGVSCESTTDAFTCLSYPQLSVLQVRVSLLDQSAATKLLPRSSAQGLGIIARECFAGGLLAKAPHQRDLDTFISDPA